MTLSTSASETISAVGKASVKTVGSVGGIAPASKGVTVAQVNGGSAIVQVSKGRLSAFAGELSYADLIGAETERAEAAEGLLQDHIDGLGVLVEQNAQAISANQTADIGSIAGLQSALDSVEAAISENEAIATSAIGAARAAAQALFDAAGSASGELAAFVSAMRSHVDLQAALRAAAVVAAGLTVATTQISDARAAIVETQQVGLAKIGDVAAAFGDFETAQVADNAAKAERLSSLETRASGAEASISSLSAALATERSASAEKADTLAAGLSASDAAGELAAFVSAARSSEAAAIAAHGVAQALAGVQRVDTALADQAKALASSSFSLAALIGQNYAAFLAQVAAQATTDQAIVASITSLQTNVTTNYATTSALASALSTAESYADGAVATLQASLTATISGNYSTLAGQITGLQSVVSDLSKASASKIDFVGASSASAAGEVAVFVAAMRDGADLAASLRKSAVNAAGVQQQQSALSDLSQSVSSLSTTTFAQFGNLYASVSSQAVAIATMQGQVAAAYSLTLDVNGFITGYQLVNGGPGASGVTFRTDKFAIAAPGGSGLAIFEVGTSGGAPAVTLRAPLIADAGIVTSKVAAEAITSFRSTSIATSYSGNGSDQTVATFNFNVPQAGSAIVLYAADTSTNTNFVGITIKIYVDGVLVATKYSVSLVVSGGSYINHADASIGGLTLSQGAHTVTVVMNGGSGSTISNQSITVFTGAR